MYVDSWEGSGGAELYNFGTTLQLYNCTIIQVYNYTTEQLYNCTTLNRVRSANCRGGGNKMTYHRIEGVQTIPNKKGGIQ